MASRQRSILASLSTYTSQAPLLYLLGVSHRCSNSPPCTSQYTSQFFNERGRVENLQLLWWNDAYAAVRSQRPRRGSLAKDTYIEAAEVIELANTALVASVSHQRFTVDESRLAVYKFPNHPTALAVTWMEFDGKIIEVAEDLSQLSQTLAELEIRRLELADAHHRQQASQLRESLARDLHDSLIQQMFVIGIGIDSVMRTVSDDAADQLRRCQELLQGTIDEIRHMVSELDASPVVDRVEIQEREIDRVMEEMATALSFRPEFRSNLTEMLSRDLRYDLIAVIREALANVARHSGATAVTVTVDRSRRHLIVAISDNGRGFNEGSPTLTPSSHGLRNMAKRAQRRGGELALRSIAPGAEVIWSVPL